MTTSPFVLPMGTFWQVLLVSVVLLFVLPLRLSHVYYWLYISGAFVSVLSVIVFGDSSGLETINAQAVPALAVALLFAVRMVIEDKTDKYLPGLLLAAVIVLVGGVVRVFSPVSGVDPDNGNRDRQPHPPPQQNPVQEPQGQQEQWQAPDEHPIVPPPEQVDADASPNERTIGEMVREADRLADEIDEHRRE